MDIKNPLADCERAEDTSDDDTTQEEDFHRITSKNSPDETRSQKAVVESLIHGEGFGLLGKLSSEIERFHSARFIPQEHFEIEEEKMQKGNNTSKNICEQVHKFSPLINIIEKGDSHF